MLPDDVQVVSVDDHVMSVGERTDDIVGSAGMKAKCSDSKAGGRPGPLSNRADSRRGSRTIERPAH